MLGGARRQALLACAILAAALAIAWVGDVAYFRHGIDVEFFATQDGRRQRVTRVVEHRTSFANRYRPLARVVQGWPSPRLRIPRGTPALDAVIRADLDIRPEDGSRLIDVQTGVATVVLVDGAPPPSTGVPVGRHDLEVRWAGTFEAAGGLTIRWGHHADDMVEVPSSRLTPRSGSWPITRTLWWLCVAVAAAGLALVVLRAAGAPAASRQRRVDVAVAYVLILVALWARAFDYDVMPEYRENADEAFAMWNGWSLLEDGTPRGWTPWRDVYEGPDPDIAEVEDVWAFGVDYRVVTPYFEHPPLLHVLAGAANHLGGTRHYLATRLRDGRRVPIALALVSLALLISVARRLQPTGPAPWLAGLLYAVTPFVALQQRVVKEEALLTVLALGMTYCFLRWRDEGRLRGWLIAAAVCAGLGMPTKVPGLALVPALVILVASARGARREVWLAGAIGIAVSATLLLYAAVIDWDVFTAAQGVQSTRAIHFNIFLRWFDDPLVNHNLFGRGWMIFVWLAAAAAIFPRIRAGGQVLATPIVVYLLAISIGSGNWTYGWYAHPVYPFLFIGAGMFLAELWQRPTLLAGFLLVTTLVLYSLNFTLDLTWAQQASSWPTLRKIVSATVALGIAPFVLAQGWRNTATTHLARAAIVACLMTFTVLSLVFVVRYDAYYDRYRNFDRVVWFDR